MWGEEKYIQNPRRTELLKNEGTDMRILTHCYILKRPLR
jgi:hypothetical protein